MRVDRFEVALDLAITRYISGTTRNKTIVISNSRKILDKFFSMLAESLGKNRPPDHYIFEQGYEYTWYAQGIQSSVYSDYWLDRIAGHVTYDRLSIIILDKRISAGLYQILESYGRYGDVHICWNGHRILA